MNQKKTTDGSMEILRRKLAGFKVAVSPSYSGLTLENLLADVQDCRVIKKNNRRWVFYMKTSQGCYFLKLSTLLRSKDRLRHFLLPGRRWAEWHNLHRLHKTRIAAASPVMKGKSEGFSSKGFFMLTEKVCGTPLQASVTDAGKFGEYMALLHSRGIYHIDLHPDNIIVQGDGQFCLIDVQEVYFLPWLPRRLRIDNLGKIFSRIGTQIVPDSWLADFLTGYNLNLRSPVYISELARAVKRHQQRHFRSRDRRCCKNSTEFSIIKQKDLRGYRRRDFKWGLPELRQALDKGTALKGEHVFAYQGVCIKKHTGGIFRRDRCLVSWKMSRALEVRSLLAPRSLGYYINHRTRYFLSEFLAGSAHLNDYLSSLTDESLKRKALKKLALWLRKIHGLNIWQRDFKSSNILVRSGDYFMVDLDGVRIRRLSDHHKIANLAQLNASLSNAVTVRDRLRFFYHYSADERPSRRQRRAVYRAVWEITTKKNTLNYNLDLAKLEI